MNELNIFGDFLRDGLIIPGFVEGENLAAENDVEIILVGGDEVGVEFVDEVDHGGNIVGFAHFFEVHQEDAGIHVIFARDGEGVFDVFFKNWNVLDFRIGEGGESFFAEVEVEKLGDVAGQNGVAVDIDRFGILRKEAGDEGAIIINRGGKIVAGAGAMRTIMDDRAEVNVPRHAAELDFAVAGHHAAEFDAVFEGEAVVQNDDAIVAGFAGVFDD